MRKITPDTYTWRIADTVEEAPNVRSLILEALVERPRFISGQYLTVFLPGFEPVEGKSYSISSSEHEHLVRLTVKGIGVFSKALLSHRVGDHIVSSAPYGFFYPDEGEERDLAFIAGGIGVTPCVSIIKKLVAGQYKKNIFLFYSNRTIRDISFKDELTVLAKTHKYFLTKHFITREVVSEDSMTNGRVTNSILDTLPDTPNTDFFISGSINFTKDVWKNFRSGGVATTQIHTEGFF